MSLPEQFKKYKELDNGWSDYTCFAQAVSDDSYSSSIIEKYFDLLIPKDDYRGCPREEMLKYLFELSNEPKI